MNPLEMLDAAIAAGDLKGIAEARRLMAETSEEVVDGGEQPINDIPDDDGSGGSHRTQCVKRPISTAPRKNKFKDRGEAKADTEIDKKLIAPLIKAGREPSRPPHKKVRATCRECHKTYNVDPSMHIISGNVEGVAITFLCSSCLYSKTGR